LRGGSINDNKKNYNSNNVVRKRPLSKDIDSASQIFPQNNDVKIQYKKLPSKKIIYTQK